MRQESHRIYLQQFAPRSPASSSSSFPAAVPPPRRNVVTTSAAVRLTDGARCVDVTRLLRGKFGLPPPAPPDPALEKGAGGVDGAGGPGGGGGGGGSTGRLDRIRSRLVELRGDGGGGPADSKEPSSSSSSSSSSTPQPKQQAPPPPPLAPGEADTLVLVGTLTSLPRNYVRFEHEAAEGEADAKGIDDAGGGGGTAVAGAEVQRRRTDGGGGGPGGGGGGGGNYSGNGSDGDASSDPLRPPPPDIRPPSQDALRNLRQRDRSSSSAVTVKASGARRRQDSTASKEGGDDDVSTVDSSLVSERGGYGDGRALDPNRDPMDLSSSQGYPVVAVDPYRVRAGPPASSSSSAAAAAASTASLLDRCDGADNYDEDNGDGEGGGGGGVNLGMVEGEVDEEDASSSSCGGDRAVPVSSPNGDELSSSLHVGFLTGAESGWAGSLPGRNGGVGTVATEPTTSPTSRMEPRPVPSTRRGEGPPRPCRYPTQKQAQQQRYPRREYEVSGEPFNVIRTVRPEENPLSVRDAVVRYLVAQQRRAEVELGLEPRGGGGGRGGNNPPSPQVRWFFQPSCRNDEGAAGKVRNVPACVDADGYCTGIDGSDDDGGGDDVDTDSNGEAGKAEGRCRGGRAAAGEEPLEEGSDSSTRHWWRYETTSSDVRNARPYRYRTRLSARDDDDAAAHHHTAQTPSSSPVAVFDSSHFARQCLGGHNVLSPAQARMSDERHRLSVLMRHESAVDNNCISGYLLKRSTRDYNVWRRVHCVLTDDRLWWVTRMRAPGGGVSERKSGRVSGVLRSSHHHGVGGRASVSTVASPISPRRSVHFGEASRPKGGGSMPSPMSAVAATPLPPPPPRIGRHHSIRLTSTLLLESDPTQTTPNSLSRLPHAFELIASSGTSHVFRAQPGQNSRAVQLRWVEALGERIVRCSEGNGMELAELIGSEEAGVRWGRLAGCAIDPMLDLVRDEVFHPCGSSEGRASSLSVRTIPKVRGDGAYLWSRTGWDDLAGGDGAAAAVAEVLRFGMDVAAYREAVRHARRVMPQVSRPVVVGSTHRGADGRDEAENGIGKRGEGMILGRARHGAILTTWEAVESVLSKSSRIVGLMKPQSVEEIMMDDDDSVAKTKRDVASAQSRISQFVEEQRVRREGAARGQEGSIEAVGVNVGGYCSLPPLDLFDELLDKFQRLAAVAEARRRRRRDNCGGIEILKDLPSIVVGEK